MTPVRKEEVMAWILAGLGAVLLLLLRPAEPLTLTYLLILALSLTVRMFTQFSLRVVKEYERLVLLRLGRYIGTRGPGLIVVLPILDQAIEIDQRQQFQEVPHESCITKDNARIDVDFLFYWRINNPELAVLRIKGLEESMRGLATALLRAVIGDISLDQALAEREHINHKLRIKIDEVTEQWGIEITTVEIREIKMPDAIQEIMSRQMAAERTRRATILEAEGYRDAARLKAHGDADALMLLDEAASRIHRNTLNLKYMDTLGTLGKGEATKYLFPMELTTIAKRLSSVIADRTSIPQAVSDPSTDDGDGQPDFGGSDEGIPPEPHTPTPNDQVVDNPQSKVEDSLFADNKTDGDELPSDDPLAESEPPREQAPAA
jgi:regulator of protease activity HflC (stomatin/prohibitin superfamily)